MNSIWSSRFEVKISPKQKGSVVEDNYSFIIAAFHKAPVISFENVKVGCKKVKKLTVINGTGESIEVQLTKCPPQFTFSLLEFTIPASGRTELEICWTPLESGSWRNVVKVQTNTVLKYDMPIICSSKDLKVLPKKAIKNPKSIAGPAQYLGNRCANDINIGFGNSIESTKLITGLNNNTCKLLKNDHESSASVYNSSTSRRTTMVLSKSKFSCNKENEREKQFQSIASSKMSNIDEIYDKKKLTFENVSSFTSICDNLELWSEANDQQINSTNNLNLSNKTEAILYQQEHIDEENSCFKNVEVEHKILNSNEKNLKGDCNLSIESDKFYDSLEDSKNCAEGRIFGISLPPVKEFTSKGLPDMDASLDFLRLVQSPACMKSKFIETSNTNFSFVSETKTDRLCNFTPNWLQTPKCAKYLADSDTANHAGGNFLNRFFLGDSPLEDKLHKRENTFEFDFHCSTPKHINNPDTDLTEMNRGKMSVNFEEESGQTLMDAHINRFTITESEKVNHYEKIETIANPDNDSLIETPNTMFVLCGGKTVTKKKSYDNPSMHWELAGSDILNRATDTSKSRIKETADDTYDSSVASGIRILQFSPPKKKTWKTSPKLCLGSQTRFTVSTRRRPSNFKTNKSVNKGLTVTHKITNKKSSPRHSSSSKSISELKLSVQKRRLEKSIKFYDPDKFISNLMKPGLHSNPVYSDLEWIELQETDLLKWLNTLLSPPDELATDKECQRVDVADLWHQVRKRNNVKLAKIHEQASLMYHTNNSLSTLRKASCALFKTDSVANVFCKLVQHIDKQLITLKEDRNFFQDIDDLGVRNISGIAFP